MVTVINNSAQVYFFNNLFFIHVCFKRKWENVEHPPPTLFWCVINCVSLIQRLLKFCYNHGIQVCYKTIGLININILGFMNIVVMYVSWQNWFKKHIYYYHKGVSGVSSTYTKIARKPSKILPICNEIIYIRQVAFKLSY